MKSIFKKKDFKYRNVSPLKSIIMHKVKNFKYISFTFSFELLK